MSPLLVRVEINGRPVMERMFRVRTAADAERAVEQVEAYALAELVRAGDQLAVWGALRSQLHRLPPIDMREFMPPRP